MGDRWSERTAVLVNVVYTVAVVLTVALALPGVRERLVAVGRRQLHAWQYGRWLGTRSAPPRWTALLARDDLPAEAG